MGFDDYGVGGGWFVHNFLMVIKAFKVKGYGLILSALNSIKDDEKLVERIRAIAAEMKAESDKWQADEAARLAALPPKPPEEEPDPLVASAIERLEAMPRRKQANVAKFIWAMLDIEDGDGPPIPTPRPK